MNHSPPISFLPKSGYFLHWMGLFNDSIWNSFSYTRRWDNLLKRPTQTLTITFRWRRRCVQHRPCGYKAATAMLKDSIPNELRDHQWRAMIGTVEEICRGFDSHLQIVTCYFYYFFVTGIFRGNLNNVNPFFQCANIQVGPFFHSVRLF